MLPKILRFYLFAFALFISLASPAQNQNEVVLPGTLAAWMDAEGRLNDTDGYYAPSRDHLALDDDYRAENANWFKISSYWIPEQELDVASMEEQIPEKLRPELVRVRNGIREYRLFIHPQSAKFYEPLTSKYAPAEEALARSTASSRTVLITLNRDSNLLFFAKLSLDLRLGDLMRTIPSGETMQSVGVTKYIQSVSNKLGANFKFIPEVLGIVPKGWPRGGQIIRLIPKEVLEGQIKLRPLFSLTKLDNGTTILEKMIRQSGRDPRSFVLNNILQPFIKGWVTWAISGGLSMEAHGQNVLFATDKYETLLGSFYLRDNGGMNIDLESPFFPKELIKNLPFISSLQDDYHQKFRPQARQTSLAKYFQHRVLYNIDRELKRIDPKYPAGQIFQHLWVALQRELVLQTGLKPSQVTLDKLKNDINQVLAEAVAARVNQGAINSCRQIFMN